jgi:transcriptional regulator with GAF, ATPase, and Fis domain/tetratricopeptide (TPR) repeat protein
MSELEFPQRYQPISRLGKGGGGEVWAVRDKHGGRRLALKVLAEGATAREMAALVREAVALSGLEGLGVPRVVRFGRLPGSARPFMVRDLVEGQSLDELFEKSRGTQRALEALALTADQLTLVHRAGLLHGDIKPANIIVEPGGRSTLVDLGLAAPWREMGTQAEGLTPRYAAPELLAGKPLTVRAEVYALGVTLAEALESARGLDPARKQRLDAVAERATGDDPSERYPSADEFASALRHAAGIPASEGAAERAALWPVVGIDSTANKLMDAIQTLPAGAALVLEGSLGSGRSALLRRAAWSLGVMGVPVAFIDDTVSGSVAGVKAEIGTHPADKLFVLVDDAGGLDAESVAAIKKARESGARVVSVGGGEIAKGASAFAVPPLDRTAAAELVRKAIPSLTDSLVERIVEACGGRPGELRRVVHTIAAQAIASSSDIERLLSAGADAELPADAIERAQYFLDKGRFNDARAALDSAEGADPLAMAIARARLAVGLGEAPNALEHLMAVKESAAREPSSPLGKAWQLYLMRAYVGLGDYAKAIETVEAIADDASALGAEALAFKGSAVSFLGKHEEARELLTRAVSVARDAGSPRAESVALTCLAFALQRNDRTEEAKKFYQAGIVAGEKAGDAGVLGTLRLNLAGLLKMSGDIAGAIGHFEAAVDMGRRSGRRSTTRQALLNLANTDLYLGRLARARASIEALEAQKSELPPVMRAQLFGLGAELAALSGQLDTAVEGYEACAAGYEALGRRSDAAEALLEAVIVAARALSPDLGALRGLFERAEKELDESTAHRPLLKLASGRIALIAGDDALAREELDDALEASREAGQREWVWRTLVARAELEEISGQSVNARRDREEALAVLEDIGARLPRDLREVYWNDPRRRALRSLVQLEIGAAATAHAATPPTLIAPRKNQISQLSPISSHATTPLEQRLARILEVNADLVGELDLERLTARVTDYAVDLTRAERGFVILREPDGELTVHTSRSRLGDEPHAEFSRSIAQRVMARGEPMVSGSALDDNRMKSFSSVHQLQVQSVACVPILAPSGLPIGALYVETRLRPGAHFEDELPTLRAFADQVAIAIETARLVNENRRRADELQKAQDRLRELLGERTERLKEARRKLRDARDTLYSHFGYHGLVGTSEAMRKVYALVDRLRDTEVPVLITGESGTGKEMVARAVHEASPRAKAKFIGVNCGAIPEHLLESELFGHVRGAFTGADRERKGLLRDAEGGSVLLDEIGEMPHKMQAGLLRVLQERKVRPVGGSEEEPADIRLIFATNKDLQEMVKDGRFREDLYYRIHVVEVRLPSLRERKEDIPQLVDHFLGIFAARYKREKGTLSREAMRRLTSFDWPGNVRQLEHVLLNAWVLAESTELQADELDLPDGRQYAPRQDTVDKPERESRISSSHHTPRSSSRRPPKSTLSQYRNEERERILKALQACNWNRVKAAELSGIPRRTFYRRLREYGIQ